MSTESKSRMERYIRFSHRGMVALLVLTLLTGGIFLIIALDPDGTVARGMPRIAGLIPVGIILVVAGLTATLRGDRWEPQAPEARAVLDDAWRQTNLARAARLTLALMILAQMPLGFLLRDLPAPRGVFAMAIATMTFGMALLVGTFLYFDHQQGGGDEPAAQ